MRNFYRGTLQTLSLWGVPLTRHSRAKDARIPTSPRKRGEVQAAPMAGQPNWETR